MRSHLLAFAAPAAAFLVLPEMMPGPNADEAEGDFRILPADIDTSFALPTSSQSQSIEVPCLECPGQDATLRFDINVHDTNRLLVNGFEVFPGDLESTEVMTARVSTANGEAAEKELDWVLLLWPNDKITDHDMRLLDLNLRVADVAGVPVNNVSLKIEVIIGRNGEMLIADVQAAKYEVEEDPPCEGWWCPVQTMWNNLTKGRMRCHNMKIPLIASHPHHPGEKMPHEHEHGEGKHHGHHGPHPHGPHGPHGHHGPHRHHLGKMITNVAAHIFLPVVLGITAGIGAAVLAMFLCSVVSFIVKRLAGREARYSWTLVPSQVVVIEEGADAEDEKHGLLDGQATPPAYEAGGDKQ